MFIRERIGAVGHRVVHGGEKFASSVVITEEVKKAIEECNDLAPLHKPANLIGITACEKLMPNTPMTAVFDTAFHQTMPEKAYMYGLPYNYYEDYKIRRYGYHGTSHSFVSKKAAEVMEKPYEELKTIVCHLGNGSSVTAVMNGQSVDTSMGMTPLEGLVMGTRSGNIDPAIMEFIAEKEHLDIAGVMDVLNKKSGVFGISGELSSDFRDLTNAMNSGDKKAKIAMDVFSYNVATVSYTHLDVYKRQIYKIRSMLEGLCARWAAEHITEEQLDQLEESLLLSEFQMKKESGFSTEQVAALDGRFHAVLYEASGSRMLKHVLTDFHNYVQRARKSSIVSEERARKSIREHRQILRAIKDRDAEMAEQLANEHIIHVMQNLKKQGY